MKRLLTNNWPILILLCLSIIISAANYTSNTILSGWDTLHPEFNFPLNIKRAIFGVFRTEQGLGAVAGHSHMADLPRILTLYLASIVLPMEFLRYFYIFLMLCIGPIGMYFFLYKIVLKNKASSFLGALFYLLNLGTMQIFIVPFEMFVAQYGFLPWVFLFATQYLQETTKSKKTLILFSITTLLSTPIAYAATLWHVQFLFFLLYVFSLSFRIFNFEHLNLFRISNFEFRIFKLEALKKSFTLILLTLLINSFWLLPNIYFILNYGQVVTEANINKLFSPQAFFYNKEFGNLKDILLMKTFYFDWNIYTKNNFTYLLDPWINYLKLPLMESIGIVLSITAFIGTMYVLVKRPIFSDKVQQIVSLAFIPGLLLCLFLLFNDNPPFGWLYRALQDTFPLFKEALRFPENKVLGLYIFVVSIYFGVAQQTITNFIAVIASKAKQSNLDSKENPWNLRARLLQTVFFTLLLLFFMFPAFTGNFISPSMRIKIPKAYFSLFKWLNNQPDDGRVANLPIHSFWGWEYYDWSAGSIKMGADKLPVPSFQGAGFLWFGFKQPLLHRDFDRWIPYNEQYYREMSYAIYTRNPQLVTNVLTKYNIHYILLDKTLITPQIDQKVLFYKETQQTISDLIASNTLKKEAEFDNTITVYRVNGSFADNYISSPTLSFPLSTNTIGMYEDLAFKQYGNYFTPQEKQNSTFYPFLSLTENDGKLKKNIATLDNQGITIKQTSSSPLIIPSYLDNEENIPTEVVAQWLNSNELSIELYPYALLQGSFYPPITASISLPKTFARENLLDITLSINQKDNFVLKNLTKKEPSSLGKILLKTKSKNTIALYDNRQAKTIIPDFTTLQFSLNSCTPTQTSKVFGINLLDENSFTIFGANTALCLILPFSNIKEAANFINNKQEVLLTTSFSYKGSRNPDICVANLITGGCLKNIVSDSFGISNSDFNNVGLKITLDATKYTTLPDRPLRNSIEETGKKEEAIYRDMSFKLIQPFFSATLSDEALRSSLKQSVKITRQESTIIIPSLTSDELTKDISTLPQTDGACPGQSIKEKIDNSKTILKEEEKEYIRYESKEGSLCDYFSYPNLPQNEAYAIAITAKHESGLPLTVCISNPSSRRCDIYASLPSDNQTNTSLFLLPSMSKEDTGFTIDINNFAIKETPSINDLYSIQVIPFPYTWLSNISSDEKNPINTSASLKTITQSFLGFKVSMAPQKEESLITLSYSFENGWKAFRVKNSEFEIQNWIKTNFPFLFGEELKDHVVVNNWANGWLLLNYTLDTKPYTLIIVFLPQYLEFFGFVLIFGVFMWFFIPWIKKVKINFEEIVEKV